MRGASASRVVVSVSTSRSLVTSTSDFVRNTVDLPVAGSPWDRSQPRPITTAVAGWRADYQPPDEPEEHRGRGPLRDAVDDRRRHQGEAVPQPRAQDRGELRRARRGRP